jgi:hypothetical protein
VEFRKSVETGVKKFSFGSAYIRSHGKFRRKYQKLYLRALIYIVFMRHVEWLALNDDSHSFFVVTAEVVSKRTKSGVSPARIILLGNNRVICNQKNY